MNQTALNQIAQDIVKNNIYLTLATSDGKPWAAPMYYCIDDKYNFYYISQLDSLHTKHILKNPDVSFAIFDSHAKEGEGNGIQATGKTYLIEGDKVSEALRWYKTNFIPTTPESFTGNVPYRLFKITPKKVYILDPKAKTDKRIEVKLI